MAKKLPVSLYEDQTKRPQYNRTNDERIKLSKVEKDFMEMINARQSIDRDRDLYQQMIEAIPRNYQDDRSTSTVPLASAFIELFVAEAIKIPTEFNFKGETSRYKQQAKIRELVWKYDRRKNNRKEEIIDNEYTTAWFWHSVIRTWFEVETVVQHELIEVDEDGNMTWDEQELSEDKIILENIDPRCFYLDNNATRGMKDANKCMVRKRVGYEEFLNLKNNKLYKNIEYVVPKNYDSKWMPYSTTEEVTRQGRFVEIREYRNLKQDIYLVRANWIIIREHHIMSTINGRKALPFTLRVLGKKNSSYYGGRGLCEMLIRFNSELNDLREMLMDWIRRSNNPTIAIGNWLTFNGRKFSFDNEILEFDWDLNGGFQQLTGVPPNQAIFEYMNRLFEQMAIFVWIDIKNILGNPQQTAYQTNVQVEASQKRINVRLTNRDLAFERMANLHMENLVKFFPRKTAEWLYPELEIEDYDVIEWGIRYNKWSSWLLAITPEAVAGDIYVDVFTNISRPPSDIADRQSKLEFVQTASPLLQLAMQAQQSWMELPLEKRINELAESYGLTMWADKEGEDMNKMKAEFKQKLIGMMSNSLQAPQWMPQPQEQQPQAPSTPSFTPNMEQWF